MNTATQNAMAKIQAVLESSTLPRHEIRCYGRQIAYFDRLTRDDEPGDPLAVARMQVHGSRVEATRAAIAKAQGADAAQAAKD